jgi:2-amino-4-hydroxy-6-hydroxymethyldihydropteridine diphosphokinase
MSAARVEAWIGLGSNLGDRLATLLAAREALERAPGIAVVASSAIYESDAVGPGEQGPYLNAVLAIDTRLDPHSLLETLLRIERELGRDRSADAVRWGPRTLDLDLLLYADLCIDEPGLEVPHPRLHERGFVLRPLAELAGDRPHPRLGGRLADWAKRPDAADARRRDDLDPRLWASGS